MKPDGRFWRDRRVLVTGHTGFKGTWLCLWLERLGARVAGLALPPPDGSSLYRMVERGVGGGICDIRDLDGCRSIVAAARPEIVFHLAAQPLVRESYLRPLETFQINTGGTANLLEALGASRETRVAVMVTTDKVYQNDEREKPYTEDDKLGGDDPYSASKAAMELVVHAYRKSFLKEAGLAVAAARAGNVIGGGDWAKDRLIPDCVRAWQAGSEVEIRRPDSVRPWQHVLDPLAAYLLLAERLWNEPACAGSYNFGPAAADSASVRSVVTAAYRIWGGGAPAPVFRDDLPGPHEAGVLRLDCAKARRELGIVPKWDLTAALGHTIEWYKRAAGGMAARAACFADIDAYERGADVSL